MFISNTNPEVIKRMDCAIVLVEMFGLGLHTAFLTEVLKLQDCQKLFNFFGSLLIPNLLLVV